MNNEDDEKSYEEKQKSLNKMGDIAECINEIVEEMKGRKEYYLNMNPQSIN